MKIAALILAYLKEKGRVRVTGFGQFSLENTAAILSAGDTILPPARKITWSPDYHVVDTDFENYVARSKKISLQEATEEVTSQVNYWKNKLNEAENFAIEELGEFKFSMDEVHFEGNRVNHEGSDFYGLEEINLSELKKKKTSADSGSYKMGKVVLWTLLLGIPVAALAYFGMTEPEKIFGKKSFNVESKVAQPEKDDPVTVADSSQIITNDSLQMAVSDSVNANAGTNTSYD